MRKTRYFRIVLLAWAGMSLNVLSRGDGTPLAWGDEPVAEVKLDPAVDAAKLDVAKGRIEGRLKDVLALKQSVDLQAEQAAAQQNAPRPADRGKGLIELGAKRLVLLAADEASGKLAAHVPQVENAGGTDLQATDAEKSAIEQPYSEELIVAGDSENPKVQPGKVSWHADFAVACKTSRQSGKPVLLFQLLGQLDQRYT